MEMHAGPLVSHYFPEDYAFQFSPTLWFQELQKYLEPSKGLDSP